MYGQRGGFRPENRFSPVKVGEEVDVTIEAVGEKGDGIAKKKGFVIFVPGAKQGQNVKVKITRVLKKMAFSEVIGTSSGPSSEQPEEQSETKEEPEEQYDTASDSDNFGDENAEESDEFGENQFEEEQK